MRLSSKDLIAFRAPGLALLAALVISTLLVRYSTDLRDKAASRNKEQSAQLQQARNRLHQSDQEQNSILQFLPAYQQLQRIGFVGGEQRLNWVESLRTANLQAGLFGVQYEIAAQAPYLKSPTEEPIPGQLNQSRMKISFGVVHEGDVLRFLKALSERQSGLYTLTGCSLDRGGLPDAPEARRANLTAQCSLAWLTFNPPKQTP